ncbi:pyridoxamine 5'-phosphate oxidase family protein, partial [Bacillus sonorensis]
MNQQIKEIHPSILYYGTPVILLSTQNEDGSTNLSPLSSSWALGDCIVIGAATEGKAFENMRRQQQCVINLPDPSLW